jgi:hypothetical protein
MCNGNGSNVAGNKEGNGKSRKKYNNGNKEGTGNGGKGNGNGDKEGKGNGWKGQWKWLQEQWQW